MSAKRRLEKAIFLLVLAFNTRVSAIRPHPFTCMDHPYLDGSKSLFSSFSIKSGEEWTWESSPCFIQDFFLDRRLLFQALCPVAVQRHYLVATSQATLSHLFLCGTCLCPLDPDSILPSLSTGSLRQRTQGTFLLLVTSDLWEFCWINSIIIPRGTWILWVCGLSPFPFVPSISLTISTICHALRWTAGKDAIPLHGTGFFMVVPHTFTTFFFLLLNLPLMLWHYFLVMYSAYIHPACTLSTGAPGVLIFVAYLIRIMINFSRFYYYFICLFLSSLSFAYDTTSRCEAAWMHCCNVCC